MTQIPEIKKYIQFLKDLNEINIHIKVSIKYGIDIDTALNLLIN